MTWKKNKIFFSEFFGADTRARWGILFAITIIFTIFLYPSLVVKTHSYKLGDVVDRNIKATKDFLIEDKDATEANRRDAVENVLTVYDYDATLYEKIALNVKTAFGILREVLETKNLSPNPSTTAEPAASALTLPIGTDKSVHDRIWLMKKDFQEKIRITVSNDHYTTLEKEAFSEEIANLITKITTEIFENGVAINKELLLKDVDKGINLRDIGTKTEKTVLNLKHLYGLDQAKTMVRIIGQPLLKNVNHAVRNLVVDFAQALIQPNITLNKNETEERKEKAVSEIKPIFYQIKSGEMILREGERVTKLQLLKLKNSQERIKTEQLLANSTGSAAIILCILVMSYILHF
ncbi:MAG: HD family phosphohydrolase, partial [Proteobacteria bacterium]|nr:HD family phosphohydrolase [Pseudomonadota bacterium]